MNPPKRILALLAVIAFLAIGASDVGAQSLEAELKGKMVGLFGDPKLVSWPLDKAPTRANPLTIGIIGKDPFVDARGVNHLEKKLVGTGSVILRFANPEAYKECHILVVSKTADFAKALAKTTGSPVLVISESPGLAAKGAAINLVFDVVANKIRLEINPATAKAANLQISPGLLRSPLVDIVN